MEDYLLTLVSVRTPGILTSLVGSRVVFGVAPLVIGIAVVGLLRSHARVAGNTDLT